MQYQYLRTFSQDIQILVNQLNAYFIKSQLGGIEHLTFEIFLLTICFKTVRLNQQVFGEFFPFLSEQIVQIIIQTIEKIQMLYPLNNSFYTSYTQMKAALLKLQNQIIKTESNQLIISLLIMQCAIISQFNDKNLYFQRNLSYALLAQIFTSMDENTQKLFFANFSKILFGNVILNQLFFSCIQSEELKIIIFQQIIENRNYKLGNDCIEYLNNGNSISTISEIIKNHLSEKFEVIMKHVNAIELEEFFQLQLMLINLKGETNNTQQGKLFKNNIRLFKQIDSINQKRLITLFLTLQYKTKSEIQVMKSLIEQSLSQLTIAQEIYQICQLITDDDHNFGVMRNQAISKLKCLNSSYYLLQLSTTSENKEQEQQAFKVESQLEKLQKSHMIIESPTLGDRYKDFLIHQKIILLIDSLKIQLKRVDPGEFDFYKNRLLNEIK